MPPSMIDALAPKKPPTGELVEVVRLTGHIMTHFGGDPRFKTGALEVLRRNVAGHWSLTQGYLTNGHVLLSIPEEDVKAAGANLHLVMPVMFGINRQGYHAVTHVLLAGEAEMQTEWRWALCRIGKPLWKLPPYLVLESYDVGHEVVVVGGEAMGERGSIQQSHGFNYTLSTGRTHRGEYLGVPRTGTLAGDIALAPLPDRLPPGSPAWVMVESAWRPGIIGEYRQGAVSVLLADSGAVWASPRSRNLLRERGGTTPPAPAPRRGTVPRSPRATKPQWQNFAPPEITYNPNGTYSIGAPRGREANYVVIDEAMEFKADELDATFLKPPTPLKLNFDRIEQELRRKRG